MIWFSLTANSLERKERVPAPLWNADDTTHQHIILIFWHFICPKRFHASCLIWYSNQLENRLGKDYLCLFWKKLKYREMNNMPISIKRPSSSTRNRSWISGILFHAKWPKNVNVVVDTGAEPRNPPAMPSCGEEVWWTVTNRVKLTVVNHFLQFFLIGDLQFSKSPCHFLQISLEESPVFSEVLPIVCGYNISNDVILWWS